MSNLSGDIIKAVTGLLQDKQGTSDGDPRHALDKFYLQVQEMVLSMQERGLPVPDEIKRRDRREPNRTEKEMLEDNMSAAVKRYWRGQHQRVIERVGAMFPDRKSFVPLDDIFDQYGDLFDKVVAAFVRYILTGMIGGIEQLAESVTVGVDWTGYNQRALDFAKRYTYDLIKGIDATSAARVSGAVQSFVELPGFTMGNLEELLTPIFGESRSRLIAVTETTRAFASGQQLAANELAKQFPDVLVVKTWFTSRQDNVCPICAPLEGMEVPYNGTFNGMENPPAHPGCFCWISTRTRFDG